MKKRVLIFDDESDILFACCLILEAKGFEAFSRQNCINAIDDVRSCQPDIVIMDYLIPETGGVIATQQIKKEFQNLPVIIFTASSHIEKITKEAGADAYLRKPFDVTEMISLINKFISGAQAV
ncbi:MAG: response regulator [Ginsengibacter sp.]